jgi:hypothetical protein
MDAAEAAKLNEADVVVLRLYTGQLYLPWNKALRDSGNAEQWATCIAVLCRAAFKLCRIAPRRVAVYKGLDGSNGWVLPSTFLHPKLGEFAHAVELGFSSTTEDFDTAVRFSGGKDSKGTIVKMAFDIADKGASIQFLSQYPDETEWLLPPCMTLHIVEGGPVSYESSMKVPRPQWKCEYLLTRGLPELRRKGCRV